MIEADSPENLQRQEDRFLARLEADPNPEIIDRAFLPAMLFPGAERRASNLEAWKDFWSGERIASLMEALGAAGSRRGFTADAFTPFFDLLADPAGKTRTAGIPSQFFNMMGIVPEPDHSTWRLFFNLTLPEGYGSDSFYTRYGTPAKIFDPALFSERLGKVMFTTFAKLLLVVAALVAGLLLFFLLDFRMMLYSLAPIVFALVCTLGTLSLLGRRLDIPSLMLATIVLGMGVDYSLFFVRSYQRYGSAAHPAFSMIRSAVVMASASTLIGFGVLATARHSLLMSAGVTSLLGIGFSAMGAFLILPPLLDHFFRNRGPNPRSLDPMSRALDRYRRMEPYPRLFTCFKARLDPMFGELPGLIDLPHPPRKIIDVGTGYGVPACWLAETFPAARIFGVEPAPERARVAARALGESGEVVCGGAPDLPPSLPSESDAAFMLDMIHYLSDAQLALTFDRLHDRLVPGGTLLIRAVMAPNRRIAWCWWFEKAKQALAGAQTFYRSAERMEAMLRESRFSLEAVLPSGRNGDMLWLKSVRSGS
jgi:SAM-dependent methyltransferase